MASAMLNAYHEQRIIVLRGLHPLWRQEHGKQTEDKK